VRDLKLREGLVAAAHGQGMLSQAPVAIVVCADAGTVGGAIRQRGRELYCCRTQPQPGPHPAGGRGAGLGSCWAGRPLTKARRPACWDLPGNHRPVAILPIGKTGRVAWRRPRRAVGECDLFE